MKSLSSGIILALTLSLGLNSTASAANIDYPQSGPVFTETAHLVGAASGTSDIDTFYFNNQTAGTYHFYSTGTTDTFGHIYSDTYLTTLASNDDGADNLNFCVEAYLSANEDISIYVQGYSSSSEGDYTVIGAVGTCADSGYYFTDFGNPAPVDGTYNPYPPTYDPTYDPNNDPNAPTTIEISAVSLPVLLFSLFGLAAVRLRRFFA